MSDSPLLSIRSLSVDYLLDRGGSIDEANSWGSSYKRSATSGSTGALVVRSGPSKRPSSGEGDDRRRA